MKYLIGLVIFIFLLSGCTMEVINGFAFDSPRFNNYSEACSWVHNNIEWKSMKGKQSPEDTLDSKKGDCAAQSILLMAIMGYQHNIRDSYYIALDCSHAVVLYKDTYYDCTTGESSKNAWGRKITRKVTYYDIMNEAYSDN